MDDVLRYGVDSGLISEAGYANIKGANRFYTPMFRAEKPALASGRTGDVSQPVKAIKGSERPVTDPFRNSVRLTVRILNEADKNMTARALTRHAGKPGAEKVVMQARRQTAGQPVESVDQLEAPELLSVGSGEAVTAAEKGAGVPSHFKKFRVYEGGVPTEYYLDPEVANALGRYGLKQDSTFFDKVVIEALATPAKVLRAGTTEMPSFFLLKNPARDQATLIFQTKAGAKPGIALVDGLMSYIKRDASYKKWMQEGGSQSTLVDMDRHQMTRFVRDLLSEDKGGAWRGIGRVAVSPFRLLQEMSQAMEASTRLGEFKAGMRNVGGGQFQRGALARGLEQAAPAQLRQASIGGRDVTTDFGVHGSARIMQQWTRIAAFSNAQLQGTDRFIRAHLENPGRAVTQGLAYLTLPSLVLHQYQMQDETYRENYRRLPNWRKFLFWNIDARALPEGSALRKLADEHTDGMIPVPIPFEWGLAYKAVPEALISYLSLNDPSIPKRLAETLANQTQPFIQFGGGGLDVVGVGVRPDFGTALTPLMDLASNRRSFFNVPIHREDELKLPKEMRFDESTAQAAVILSEWMRGLFSPKEIQVLIQGWFGSLGRSGLEAASRLAKPGPYGEVPRLKPLADSPVLDFMLGGLLGRGVEQGSSQVVENFWDRYEKAKQQSSGAKENLTRLEFDKAIEGSTAPNVPSNAVIELTASKLSQLTRMKREIGRSKSLTARDKEKQIRQLNDIIDRLASTALEVPQRPDKPAEAARGYR